MQLITNLIAALVAAFLWCAPASAQMTLGIPGGKAPPATYQGPGDVVGSAVLWASCSRVYSGAKASTATSMCDLNAVTGGAAVCTLRGSSTGLVDLTAYCPGSLTPSAACAAASGGSCVISKYYDQTGNGHDCTQATLSNMPPIAFSVLNGLPGTVTANATVSLCATGNITQAQPFTFSVVCNYTANTGATTATIGAGASAIELGWLAGGGSAQVNGAFSATAAITTFHAMQAVVNGASPNSVLAIDGTETTGSSGAAAFSAEPVRFMRGGGDGTPDGKCMEFGLWGTNFSGTQRTNMNSNQHSATNGYNF